MKMSYLTSRSEPWNKNRKVIYSLTNPETGERIKFLRKYDLDRKNKNRYKGWLLTKEAVQGDSLPELIEVHQL